MAGEHNVSTSLALCDSLHACISISLLVAHTHSVLGATHIKTIYMHAYTLWFAQLLIRDKSDGHKHANRFTDQQKTLCLCVCVCVFYDTLHRPACKVYWNILIICQWLCRCVLCELQTTKLYIVNTEQMVLLFHLLSQSLSLSESLSPIHRHHHHLRAIQFKASIGVVSRDYKCAIHYY